MTDSFSREVYVSGVGMTAFGRHEGKTVAELGQEAVKAALADAGVDYSAVEIAYCGHVMQGLTAGQKVLYGVGMTGVPIFNVENACASGTSALRSAVMAVGFGMAKVALAVGFEVMGRGAIPTGGDQRLEALARDGAPAMPSMFANLFRLHAERYGTTVEQMAMVSVKNRGYGAGNPRAQFHDPVTVDDVMRSREVAPPLRLLMCCPTSSGAAAAVVTSADVARTTRRPIRVVASALQSDPALGGGDPLAGITEINSRVMRAAYEQAGIGPDRIDCAEVHDCFSIAEIIHYENLGLCARGEGGRFVEQGLATARVKVSTSGGLLAKGHPLGATGVAQAVEAVEQLRGESGARQVPNARVALTHCQGFGGAAGVHIFTA
ncbi:Nonspecific lipid-transfer protein [Candidatus Binatia bacterium]|nr:Nonspecific lipid-transfer protein [Candidatus Binatia bacterium]